MNQSEKLAMVKTLMGITDTQEDERIGAYLHAAELELLQWRYSYASEVPTEVPAEYEMTQVHAVIAGYSLSGAENQLAHSENGISRTFKYADMVDYIRAHVIPIAKVI